VTLLVLIDCNLLEAEGFIFRRRFSGQADEVGSSENNFVPVRVLPLEILKSVENHKGDWPFETRYGAVSQRTRTKLLTVNHLVQAVQNPDGKLLHKYVQFKAAEEASEEALYNDFSEYGGGELLFEEERERLEPGTRKQVLDRVKGNGHPIAELSAEFYRIASSQLVLWWRSKERDLAAGIYCSSLEAALFALLLSRVSMPEGRAICTRCWKAFSRSRIKQKFCSRRCGNSVRQARRRAKRKENVRDGTP
jgi:hypothetical protein